MDAPQSFAAEGVRGLLHAVPGAARGLVLAHGAGSDCRAPLMAVVAGCFAAAGCAVLRCDLPFRQKRPAGPPRPGDAALDRQGLLQAVAAMRGLVSGPVFLGGHSYGGRQASILASQDSQIAAALLLLSYPLHPPRQRENLRTAHFPDLRIPSVFVHGQRDPFGSPAEMESALNLIPGPHRLFLVSGGHDLAGFSTASDAAITALLGDFHPSEG